MAQEEKQLLLIDLCARLPYGVTCQFTWTYCNETTNGEDVIDKENDNIRNIDIDTKEIQAAYYGEWVDLEHCKPYLRPISSMTEEEREEFRMLGGVMSYSPQHNTWAISAFSPEAYDWLNKKMFDFRGLIPMGLALEASERMYKTK